MKTNENKSIKTQIEIVKSLLDGSNKSQRQIANEIGKEESTVSKALGYLVKDKVVAIDSKIINSGKHNKGLYKNNLCCLNYDLNNGLHILKFLKHVFTLGSLRENDLNDLVSVLQKNDKILDLLRDMHPELCQKELPSGLIEKQRKQLIALSATPTQIEVAIRCMEAIPPAEQKEFKQYLKGSPTFFELCLLNDSKQISERVDIILLAFIKAVMHNEKEVKARFESASRDDVRDAFFSFCFLVDELKI